MKWIHSIVSGILCYGALSFGGSANAVAPPLDAQWLSGLAQRADCSHLSTARADALRVCGWIDAYKRGEFVPEGDFLAQRRYIGKGFRVYANGRIEPLLMAVGYRLTNNFHKKIYYPNLLCSLFVVPTSPREEKSVEDALANLGVRSVADNAAVNFAREYEWTADQCKSVTTGEGGRELISSDGSWRATRWRNPLIFLAEDDSVEDALLIFQGINLP